MIRRPPISTRTDTLFPYTTLFRSYAESNENLVPYGLLKHVHMPEMARTIERLSGGSAAGLVFTPHLVPMTRSEEHTSELQSLMRISYAVFCLKKKNIKMKITELWPGDNAK